MKFFIDTANINEIREAAALGILDGVTTNPSLVAKEGKPFKETILSICDAVNGPVSVEVVATDAGTMCKEGQEYAKWHKNVVVKLPTTRDGIKACKCLSEQGIKINMTLCFSPTQVLTASVRHPLHVVEAALAGSHVATIPFKVLDMMFNHPLTDKGLAQFLKDWEKAKV